MKIIQKNWYIVMLFSICFSQEVLPLTERYFHTEDMGHEYQRGTYLIVLADTSLRSILTEDETGDFIKFKQTQGYDVKIVSFDNIGGTANFLRTYLQIYFEDIDPMLEYVLLIGDINGSYTIPSFTIPSYNESDLDVTDYPYTFFNNDPLSPKFFIGRWSIRTQDDLKKIKMRSIQYIKMDYLSDHSFLDNALLVAGNYSDTPPSPVTPVMTSIWLQDRLNYDQFNQVDTAFYHLSNLTQHNPLIETVWNNGVGIINYRGWGDANGWHYPYFHREEVDPGLNNGMRLPIVLSFVCNTGDFGNDYSGAGLDKCFGEVLITGGSMNNPKGAAAMIGPSDLDTDTRFNNVMCAVMWDEMLEGRTPELAPALHAGKQALIKEFGDLEVNGTNIVEFYHHVYGVLGDPSLSVWLGEPQNMKADIEVNPTLSSSYVSTVIKDEASDEGLINVVGALIYKGELIAKGLSNGDGLLVIDFSSEYANSEMTLYLNKDQYYQKEISLTLGDLDDETAPENDYVIPLQNSQYKYEVNVVDYNWIEIKGRTETDSLYLTDDSIIERDMGQEFTYYGETYDTMTVCSNGWVSFEPCLKVEGENNACSPLPYFYNNSITNPLGPYAMIAPFFDDLDDDGQSDSVSVYLWTNGSDSTIVEWDEVANNQTNQNCLTGYCEKETFQLILNGTSTSQIDNGEIIFQYKEIHDIDDHGSTIGIESPDKNSGTEFLFNKEPESSSQLLQNSLAIKFTQICDGPIALDACDCAGNKMDCNSICGGDAVIDHCGVCGGDNSSCVLGCTYSGSENYNAEATINDGSCIIKGCTDVYSDNYSASATQDDGSCNTMAIDNNLLPEKFSLNTYPNPFNPAVRVSFALPEMGLVSVRVFDIRGRELAVLSNQNYGPGYYSVNWNASTYSSGVYFISLKTNDTTITQKVLLLK
jgi:hypothetical protein